MIALDTWSIAARPLEWWRSEPLVSDMGSMVLPRAWCRQAWRTSATFGMTRSQAPIRGNTLFGQRAAADPLVGRGPACEARAMSGHHTSRVSSLADATQSPYWLDDDRDPRRCRRWRAPRRPTWWSSAGGYLGLWTALLAKERDPGRDVLLLEAATCGHAASGRNGGFCEASLTHGFGNGLARWPEELDQVLRLGHDNLRRDPAHHRGPRHRLRLGQGRLPRRRDAAAPGRVAPRRAPRDGQARARPGLARTATRSASGWTRRRSSRRARPRAAIVEPARLAWGLRAACLSLGVRIHEHSPVTGLGEHRAGVEVATRDGRVTARDARPGHQRLPAPAASAAA